MLNRRHAGGFTLVEMLIALAVGAIVLSAAVPTWQDALRKSRRTDAIGALLNAQLVQERWRADHPDYAASLGDLGLRARTPAGLYRLTVGEAGDSGYTLMAQAEPGSSQAGDRPCHTLRVTMEAGALRYDALDAQGEVSDADGRRCWAR